MPEINKNKVAEKKKSPLGRGLGSLLSPEIDIDIEKSDPFVELERTTPQDLRMWKVPIHKVIPNRNQPRRVFNQQKIKELADSIREKGILQPVVVRKNSDGTFEIIAGERRWRAAQLAQLQEIPIIIKASDDQDALELALIENIQRENLNPIEEAEAYQQLADKYSLTQVQIAAKVSKERATVANAMRLLSLDTAVRQMVAEGSLSVGHAKVLLSLESPQEQLQIARKIVSEKMSVRTTESEIAKLQKQRSLTAAVSQSENQVKKSLIDGLSQELQKSLGTKVRIDYSKAKGKINLFFYSDEGLSKLVDVIRKGSSVENRNG